MRMFAWVHAGLMLHSAIRLAEAILMKVQFKGGECARLEL